VALAKLVLQRANLLVLDEPTNHLDLAAGGLEEVLDDFSGYDPVGDHDRYLVDRLATQLWIIKPAARHLELFCGYLGRVHGGTERTGPGCRKPAPPRTNGPWEQPPGAAPRTACPP